MPLDEIVLPQDGAEIKEGTLLMIFAPAGSAAEGQLRALFGLKGVGEAFEKARNLRAKCQVANIGLSLAILGVIVPVFTRLRTKKSDAAKRAQQQKSPAMDVQKGTQSAQPLVSSFKSKASNPTFTRFKTITNIKKENK